MNLLKVTACSLALGLFVPLSPSAAQPSGGWTPFTDKSGTTVQYPREMLPVEGVEEVPPGPAFSTQDGKTRLHIFSVRNERNESPAQFLRRVFPKDRGQLTYDRVTRRFFVVSEPKDGNALYRRCNFPGDGFVHCFDMRYPLSEKNIWDRIVTRISLSLRPR